MQVLFKLPVITTTSGTHRQADDIIWGIKKLGASRGVEVTIERSSTQGLLYRDTMVTGKLTGSRQAVEGVQAIMTSIFRAAGK